MELEQYIHAACVSPVKSTMISAAKKHYFKSWPGLTTQIIPKHLPVQLQSTTSEKIKNKDGRHVNTLQQTEARKNRPIIRGCPASGDQLR